MPYYSDKRRGRHFHWSLECPMTGPHYQVTTESEILGRELNPCGCILKVLSKEQVDYLAGLPLPITQEEREYVLECLEDE